MWALRGPLWRLEIAGDRKSTYAYSFFTYSFQSRPNSLIIYLFIRNWHGIDSPRELEDLSSSHETGLSILYVANSNMKNWSFYVWNGMFQPSITVFHASLIDDE